MIAFSLITIILIAFNPKLDMTHKGDVLLWYGINKRQFVYLFTIKNPKN